MVVLPPGPRCARCGHVVCPFCGDWCDVLGRGEAEGELCCEGECIVDAADVIAWRERWDAEIRSALDSNVAAPVVVAEGPIRAAAVINGPRRRSSSKGAKSRAALVRAVPQPRQRRGRCGERTRGTGASPT